MPDFATAGGIGCGMGKETSYRLACEGKFPVPVLRLGYGRLRVTRASIWRRSLCRMPRRRREGGDLAVPAIEDYVAEIVANAPPLTKEQSDRLALLLLGTNRLADASTTATGTTTAKARPARRASRSAIDAADAATTRRSRHGQA